MAVLRREVRRARLRRRRAEEAIEDLGICDIVRLSHRPLLADEWSLLGHVSAYDALYVAAARARGAVLITADGPLARARALGIGVHSVR